MGRGKLIRLTPAQFEQQQGQAPPVQVLPLSIPLDADLAEELLKHVNGKVLTFNRWPDERKVQYLAPILWKQLQRNLDRAKKEQR